MFTVRMGERVPFGLWLLSAVLHMGAAVCASEVRDPLQKHSRGETPLEVAGNDSGEELLLESAEAMAEAEETAEEMVVDVEVATGVGARAGAVRAVEVTVVAATEVEMVAVVTAEEVMARMQESKRGSLLG